RRGRDAGGTPFASAGDDRVADLRFGLLSRPTPWLSLGATVDHAAEPRLSGTTLAREYVLGLGVRPMAWLRPLAHTLGTRLTLDADLDLREGASNDAARIRAGAELELVPGIA